MERAKHAHGSRKNLENAIAQGVVNEFDVLFLSGEGESNAIGWVSKTGEAIIIDPVAEVSKLEAELETELATKANAEEVAAELATKVSTEEVDAKIETVVTEKVTEQVETIVTEKVETVVSEKVDTQVETIVETKVDEAMDEKVTEAVNTAKEYTDAKIAEIEEAASYEIIEF